MCREPILAVGGQLKNTFALGIGDHAIVSHHIGDLDHLEAYESFREAIEHYEKLFEVSPKVIAHDLHPDYASTRFAMGRDGTKIAVQHHHAHLASCMAENRLNGEVIGVTLDGSGYGTDETVWGGEFLIGGYETFRRIFHLRQVPMPGGEAAIHQPWRMALSHLLDANIEPSLCLSQIPPSSLTMTKQMIQRGVRCPITSSMGRLFDAVGVIIGGRSEVSHEGQAAIELEWLVEGVNVKEGYPSGVDTRPMIRAIVQDVQAKIDRRTIAAKFHFTIAHLISSICQLLRDTTGLNRVVLGGGVFLNAVLTKMVEDQMCNAGFELFRHEVVPPGDGGLCLGQLAIAAAKLEWK